MKFPLVRQYNWLIFSIINPAIAAALRQFARGTLLDVGCGQKPYAGIISSLGIQHVGVDIKPAESSTARQDVVASAYALPFHESSFDAVLCTDVLEHLAIPGKALTEINRVLKQEGKLILTVPLFWHIHEQPADYYRFTNFGLHYLLQETGMRVEVITGLTGFWATFGQELSYYLWGWRRGGMLNPLWWIVPPVVHAVQAVSYVINKVERESRFSGEWLCVATKCRDSKRNG